VRLKAAPYRLKHVRHVKQDDDDDGYPKEISGNAFHGGLLLLWYKTPVGVVWFREGVTPMPTPFFLFSFVIFAPSKSDRARTSSGLRRAIWRDGPSSPTGRARLVSPPKRLASSGAVRLAAKGGMVIDGEFGLGCALRRTNIKDTS